MSDLSINVNDRVMVVKGRFAGCVGTVWTATKSELGVDFDVPFRGDTNAYVRVSSVRVLRRADGVS